MFSKFVKFTIPILMIGIVIGFLISHFLYYKYQREALTAKMSFLVSAVRKSDPSSKNSLGLYMLTRNELIEWHENKFLIKFTPNFGITTPENEIVELRIWKEVFDKTFHAGAEP